MGFLLDTNVIGETVGPRPHAGVLSWFASERVVDMFLASITLGELVRDACRLKDEDRRHAREQWISRDLAQQFVGRILPFDREAAVLWGRIIGGERSSGAPKGRGRCTDRRHCQAS